MDGTPTSLFDSYEHDFQQILSSIIQKLDTGDASNHDRVEQRKAALRRVEMELDEAEELVSQMELELQGIPTSVKSSYQSRIKSAKAEVQKFKKQSRDMHTQISRSDLLSRPLGSAYPASDDPYSTDRTRLLASTALLDDGTRRLQDSHRIALDTEAQGADILTSLRGQREQIQNSRDLLQRADTSIDRAGGTLKKMIRRMYQQRVVTGAIIAILVLIILLILYFKLVR